MNLSPKQRQLRKYKWVATGLFVLMAAIFVVTTLMQKNHSAHWIGYVKAFSEAAMVGALADWFAVTALFHHPMGLKIPHTNLIQKKKEKIGDNLGNFVLENFLTPQNLRPYILKLKAASLLSEWLSKEKNQNLLIAEASALATDILHKIDDSTAMRFITQQAQTFTEELKPNLILANGLNYLLENNDHQRLITHLAQQLKNHLAQNKETVRKRVEKESFILIPKLIDHALADKITQGLADYFDEIQHQSFHPVREEITQKLREFSKELKTLPRWEKELQTLKANFLNEEVFNRYAKNLWISLKSNLINALTLSDSSLKKYLKQNLSELAQKLQTDEKLQYKIDQWVRVNTYKHLLKNTHRFANLIRSTVGNWEGRELSDKLELEVGKDLQFIRINGTLVGGLVGLVIYTLTHFFI